VTFHGLALNLDTDPAYFELINPCGLPAGSVISLQKLIDRSIDKSKVICQLVNAFQQVFDFEIVP
jgi:lipoyl(octanoyl) transferase